MIDDPNVNRVIRLIQRNGFRVTMESDSVAATNSKTGETFIVCGEAVLTMAAELAGQVGIDLMDGQVNGCPRPRAEVRPSAPDNAA